MFSGLQQSRRGVIPGEAVRLRQREDVAAQIGQRLELASVRQFDRRQGRRSPASLVIAYAVNPSSE